MHYYDVSQDWVVMNETEYLRNYFTEIKPILIKYFAFEKKFVPYDMEVLWNNREVVQHLRWANSNNYFQLSLYKDIEKEANDLIRRIETELQRDK